MFQWEIEDAPEDAKIRLDFISSNGKNIGYVNKASDLLLSSESYTWTVPRLPDGATCDVMDTNFLCEVKPGQYKIRAVVYKEVPCDNCFGPVKDEDIIFDESDGFITIFR